MFLQRLKKRTANLISGTFLIAAILTTPALQAVAAEDFSKEMIVNDPAAPTSGNPAGDVTIVAFLDYNCPFCKQVAPDLKSVVEQDGNIRLVYKDWPILTGASKYGARAALAAKYQGKYQEVHHALMRIAGRGISEAQMRQAISASGIDMGQLEIDMSAHAADIDVILNRNLAQADGLGLQGTPAFLVGSFMVPSVVSLDEFKKLVAEARSQANQ